MMPGQMAMQMNSRSVILMMLSWIISSSGCHWVFPFPSAAPMDGPAPVQDSAAADSSGPDLNHDAFFERDLVPTGDHSMKSDQGVSPDATTPQDGSFSCLTWEEWDCPSFASYYCVTFCGGNKISCNAEQCSCNGEICPGTVSSPVWCSACADAFAAGCCHP